MASAFARAKLARLAAALNASAGHAGLLPPLVLLTDDDRLHDPLAAARRLPRGSLVVVRARAQARRRELALSLAIIARRRWLKLVVADDADLALRIGADGVHFPERNHGAIAAFRARRPRGLITASAHSLGACVHAARCGADAVFLSPIFPTRSHPDRPALTAIRLRAIARLAPVPIYALGGIDAQSALRLKSAKLAGLAAIGALAV